MPDAMKAADYVRDALSILETRGDQYGSIQEACNGAASVHNMLFKTGFTVDGPTVCRILFCLKMARYDRIMNINKGDRTPAQNKALEDSVIDGINYLGLIAEIEEACELTKPKG